MQYVIKLSKIEPAQFFFTETYQDILFVTNLVMMTTDTSVAESPNWM